MASIPFISHRLALRGLPNVGDPFDVEKYGHFDIADKDNAFVDYSAARLLIQHPNEQERKEQEEVVKSGWSKAGPALKALLVSNKAAMDRWRQGTDKADALYIQPKTYNVMTGLPVVQPMRGFARLAIVEGRVGSGRKARRSLGMVSRRCDPVDTEDGGVAQLSVLSVSPFTRSRPIASITG